MATVDERMAAAWSSGGAGALGPQVERAAREGVPESDILGALERLLLSLRETGLDDESDDRINEVMDRLTGWGHPSGRIRTARDAAVRTPEPGGAP